MADGRIYMLQPSFAAGEISPDVASRVDLDKYQSALLQADNVFVRPYGSAYRRPGTEYVDDINAGKVRLKEFAVDAETSYLLVFKEYVIYVYKDDALVCTINSTPFKGSELPKLRFAQSADVMFIASGKHPVQVLTRTGATTFTLADFNPNPGYFDDTTNDDSITITPSGTSGSITLTSSTALFTSGQVGNWMQINQDMAAATVSLGGSGTSAAVWAAQPGWKIISHGTWAGSFTIEYSLDGGGTWKTLRTYSSNNDFNVTESGTFDEPTPIRLTASIGSGSFSADLTRLPFTDEGTVRITAYTDTTHVTAQVYNGLGSTAATKDWAFGSWSADYGYPSCVTFFQDRLCFAANDRQPYMVWMSRTGDYYNFGVEKVSGDLTDDSAVAISFISRRDYRILHLMAQADLLVLTEGNEWIISGREVVTPKNISPQVQTSRGCTDVTPEMVGGQMIYVQRHGKTVRDLQYNYTIDSYDGMDLNILAKHITQDTVITDSAYRQEPDYMCFFVMDDGTVACLTYVNEQKVFAWSRMQTQGKIVSVEAISTPLYEDVYFAVERGDTVFLEKLAYYPHNDDPDSYLMIDCAARGTNVTPSNTITAEWLANQDVEVLADGRRIPNLTADNTGTVTLDVPCTKYAIGLKYTSTWELPNIEIQLQDGTLQGRRKKVSEVILRLERSLGGRVGMATNKTDVIKYDELLQQDVTLYSGEKLVTVPNVTIGGFNDKGRVVIVSDDPYPLSLSSIVRAVVPGG